MNSKCLPDGACIGTVNIRTAIGSRDVSCNEARTQKWIMPGSLTYGNCVDNFQGIHPCDGSPSVLLNCGGALNITLILMFCASFVLGLSLLAWKRWHTIRRAFREKGNELVFLRGGLGCRQASGVVAKYGYWLLFLYLVFGVKFVEMCLVPVNGVAPVTSGSILCTNKGNFTILTMGTSFILAHAYDTSDWNLATEKDWGCVGGACPAVEDCHEALYSQLKYSEGSVTKSFCKNHAGACAFGRGCTIGNHKLTMTGPIAKVYRLTLQRPTILTDMSLGDCEVSYIKDPLILSGPHSVVRLPKGNFLCPGPINTKTPMFKTLGDIQIKAGQVGFPWTDLQCSESWYNYHDCRIPNPFFPLIEQTCVSIPGPYAGGTLHFTSGGMLMLSDNNQQQATVRCNGNTTIITTKAHCSVVSMEVWGIRDHSTGLFLSSLATSQNSLQEVTVDHPCYPGEKLLLACNGEYQYWPLNEYDGCANASDKTITDHQAVYLGHSSDVTSLTWTKFNSGLNIPSLLMGSMANVIIWVALLSLLCRR